MATEAYPFYAYWNGEQVSDLWTTIAAMTSTSDYRTLLICVAVGGFLAVMMGAAVRYRGQDAIAWCAATLLLFSVAFIPRININVLDVRGGYTQVIKDIPIGIGWPASTISRISYWLTQTFETAFNDVEATSYTRFGMAFPQRVVTSVLALKPMTEYGRVSLVNFAERCIVPEILDNPTKRQALMTAPDIYALISTQGWVNPARRVMIADQVQTCPAALETLRDALEKHELPALESMLVTRLSQTADDVVTGSVRAAIPNAEAVMLGVSRSLTESLRQSVMMAAIPQATMNTAAKAGQAPLTAGVAMARAQGNLASEINYRTLSEMAKSALPKLRNLLEFIVIGLFPITFLLAIGLGTGGVIVIRAYFTLLISVSLWAPITAIMNYLMIHVDAEPMNRMVEAAGGVTLAAATMIREGGATSQAMAGSLMWLVPVLSYAVAKGSDMALTSMASSVLAPASSAAQSQGSTLAAGNVAAGNASLSNVSANNVNANKTDLSSAYGDTNRHTSTSAYGTWQGDRSTGAVTTMTVAQTDLGVSLNSQLGKENIKNSTHMATTDVNRQSQFSEGKTFDIKKGHSIDGGVNSTEGWTKTDTDTRTTTVGNNEQYQTGISTGNRDEMGKSGQVAENFGNASGLSLAMRKLGDMDEEGSTNTPTPLLSGLANNLTPGLSALTNGVSKNPKEVSQPISNQGRNVEIGMRGVTESRLNENATQGLNTEDKQSLTAGITETETKQGGHDERYTDQKHATQKDVDQASKTDAKSINKTNTEARRASNQKGRTFTSNNNAKLYTTIDMGNRIRDEALNEFNNPTDALESLNNSNSRLNFEFEMDRRANENDNITNRITDDLPSQKSSNPNFEKKKSELEKEHTANVAGVTGAYLYSAGERYDENKINYQPNKTIGHITDDARNSIFLNSAITRVATAKYINEEVGPGNVILLSYLGGIGHKSPEEKYDDLYNEAMKNPGLKNELLNIGKEMFYK